MKIYMNEAINEAKKAYKKNEVPVGAVIVKNNKIIAKAHNMKENKNIASYHAEILAINKACKKNKNWRLNDCTLYVTMEPCIMCCGAIIQSRIKKVVYGVKNENYGFSKILIDSGIEVISEFEEATCKEIIVKFFEETRN